MKQKTKFNIENHLISPLVIIMWTICIIPMAVAVPFEWTLQHFVDWAHSRRYRLIEKYGLKIDRDQNNIAHITEVQTKQFQPYLGNTILDNVNPEFLVSDKLSKRYGNSLEIGLHICKKCCRKLIKQYGIFDEAVIIYSRTVNTVIDVVDKNSFTKEYPNVKFLEHF